MLASHVKTLEHWLIDLYLFSTVLLVAGLFVIYRLRQPARRMVVARSIAMGLFGLAIFAIAPRWPRIRAIEWQPSRPARAPRVGPQLPIIEIAATKPADRSAMNATIGQLARTVFVAPPARGDLPVPNPSPAYAGLPPWRSMLIIVFTIGAATNLAWLVLGAIQATLLRRSSRTATRRIQLLVARMSCDHPHSPRVGVSTLIGLPVAIGMVRPMIVVPGRFAENEPDHCLEAALAHEWAHIRNGDLRWLALLRLLNVVLFAQPLFWWLRRTIRADQEAIADAAASTLYGDGRLAYAETLVGWARSSYRPHPGALSSAALALWERPSMLHRRVHLLLDRNFRVVPVVSRPWRLGAACLGLLASFLLSLVSLRPAASAQAMKARPVELGPKQPAAQNDVDTGQRLEFAGRVLDPDSKPLAGAKLHVVNYPHRPKTPPVVRATTDAEGRFHFTIAREEYDDESFKTARQTAQVVATSEGFGLGWSSSPAADGVDHRDLTIRLTRDDVPIVGTVVDLQGRPVAGATIQEQQVFETENGNLSAWLDVCKRTNGGSQALEQLYLKRRLWPEGSGLPTARTDANGRFTMRGVGRERMIRLRVEAPVIVTRNIGVLTRRGDPIRVNRGRGHETRQFELFYGAQFSYAAEPAKAVIGIVKDRETGALLAGVRVACEQTGEFSFHNNNAIETASDANGRYRLDGLPQHVDSPLLAIPAAGQPYLPGAIAIPKATSLEPVIVDVGLKRGIAIEGHVTDQETGKPIRARVEYKAYQDNPNLAEAPGFEAIRIGYQNETMPDGSFRVFGLPGRGVVAASAIPVTRGFLRGVGLPEGTALERLPLVPKYALWSFNTFADIDLPRSANSIYVDLALVPGLVAKGTVVGPEGQPLAGARLSREPWYDGGVAGAYGEFTIGGFRSGEERDYVVWYDKRKLVATVKLRGGTDAPVIKLEPCAAVTGRIVDEDGNPRPKILLHVFRSNVLPVESDVNGRFHVDVLIPRIPTTLTVSTNRISRAKSIAEGLVLGPGEVKDLGDVTVSSP